MRGSIKCGRVLNAKTKEGIAGISVTDGRNVTKTDDYGYFSLNGWKKEKFIYVTPASGYECKDFYKRIDKNIKEYNFYFEKSRVRKGESHSFLQISDTEITNDSNLNWLCDIKSIIDREKPSFLIHTGDICYKYGLENHIKFMNGENMGCKTYYVIGNHDYVDGSYGEELYESIYGPTWYSFEIGKVHYVVTPIHYGDKKSRYSYYDSWKWLKNDLNNKDDDMKLIVFNHTVSPKQDYVMPLNFFDKLDLKKYNLAAWIFGHYHYNYVYKTNDVLNISTARPDSGGIDSSPAAARLITVGETIETKMIYKGMDESTEPENSLWNIRLLGNALFCDTLFENGFLYTATCCDDSPCNCGVYCVDSENGEIKWFFKTDNSVKNNICLYQNIVFAMDVQGEIYCIDKKKGSLIWKKRVGLGCSLGTSSAIEIWNETLFVGCSREVTALNINNGDIKWNSNLNRGENSPAEFTTGADKLLVNSHWDALIALDTLSGKKIWANNDENLRFRSSTPVFIDSRMILVADSNAIMIVNSKNGVIESKKVFKDIDFSTSAKPIINGDTAYIPTVNKGVIAYNLIRKKIIAEFLTDENKLFTAPYAGEKSRTVESTPIIDGETLYFGANDGYIYAVDIKTNRIIRKYNVGSAVLGKIAVNKNRIFACGFKGYLACFKK